MVKMGLNEDMTLNDALELYPETYGAFKELGLCCVNDDNLKLTVRALCESLGKDAANFIDRANSTL